MAKDAECLPALLGIQSTSVSSSYRADGSSYGRTKLAVHSSFDLHDRGETAKIERSDKESPNDRNGAV